MTPTLTETLTDFYNRYVLPYAKQINLWAAVGLSSITFSTTRDGAPIHSVSFPRQLSDSEMDWLDHRIYVTRLRIINMPMYD